MNLKDIWNKITGTKKRVNRRLVPGRVIKPRATTKSNMNSSYMRSVISSTGIHDPFRLIEIVADFNPDVSLAIWNFMRMVVPAEGIKLEVKTSRGTVDVKTTKRLLELTNDNTGVYGQDYGGGVNQIAMVLLMGTLVYGAIAGEVEVSDDLEDVLDWCVVNPQDIEFDTIGGHFYPYTNVVGESVYLFPEQFRYVPLDPKLGDPRGRAPLFSCLEVVFFQSEVLRDLKAVAHTQGQPRIHFSVLEEIAMSHVPEELFEAGQEEALRSWMDSWLTELADAYKEIEPDDALVTWDWVIPKPFSGGKGSFDLNGLIKVIETQIISATKQLPILLGRVTGMGLAHGTVQWELFAQGVKALRRVIDVLITWYATQTIRIWGVNGQVDVDFPEFRTQDRNKVAAAEAAERQNALFDYRMGWVTNEELAMKFVGHPPVREPMMGSMLQEEEPELEEEMQNAEGGNRAGEADHVDTLPLWMRSRYGKLATEMTVRASVHREKFNSD